MNTSATGGYLLPDGEAVPNDQSLEDIFQGLIVGVTGLSGKWVRPRFQTEPPPIPSIKQDWVAFVVQNQTPDDGPYFEQSENQTSIRHERLEVFLSFYGPNGQMYSKRFIDGLAIPQNIDQILEHKIKFIEVGRVLTAPDKINEQYVHRFDVTAVFARKTKQVHQIKTFQDFEIKIN